MQALRNFFGTAKDKIDDTKEKLGEIKDRALWDGRIKGRRLANRTRGKYNRNKQKANEWIGRKKDNITRKIKTYKKNKKVNAEKIDLDKNFKILRSLFYGMRGGITVGTNYSNDTRRGEGIDALEKSLIDLWLKGKDFGLTTKSWKGKYIDTETKIDMNGMDNIISTPADIIESIRKKYMLIDSALESQFGRPSESFDFFKMKKDDKGTSGYHDNMEWQRWLKTGKSRSPFTEVHPWHTFRVLEYLRQYFGTKKMSKKSYQNLYKSPLHPITVLQQIMVLCYLLLDDTLSHECKMIKETALKEGSVDITDKQIGMCSLENSLFVEDAVLGKNTKDSTDYMNWRNGYRAGRFAATASGRQTLFRNFRLTNSHEYISIESYLKKSEINHGVFLYFLRSLFAQLRCMIFPFLDKKYNPENFNKEFNLELSKKAKYVKENRSQTIPLIHEYEKAWGKSKGVFVKHRGVTERVSYNKRGRKKLKKTHDRDWVGDSEFFENDRNSGYPRQQLVDDDEFVMEKYDNKLYMVPTDEKECSDEEEEDFIVKDVTKIGRDSANTAENRRRYLQSEEDDDDDEILVETIDREYSRGGKKSRKKRRKSRRKSRRNKKKSSRKKRKRRKRTRK